MRSVVLVAARLSLLFGAVVAAAGWGSPPGPSPSSSAELGRATLSVAGGRLRIEACADDVIRVAFAKDDAFFARPSLMAAPRQCVPPTWKLTATEKAATIATAKLRVEIGRASCRERVFEAV